MTAVRPGRYRDRPVSPLRWWTDAGVQADLIGDQHYAALDAQPDLFEPCTGEPCPWTGRAHRHVRRDLSGALMGE